MEKGKSKRVGLSLTDEEYKEANDYAYNLRLPLSTIAKELLMEAVKNNHLPPTEKEQSNQRIESLEKQVGELLTWKKQIESSQNSTPLVLDDDDVNIDWDEMNANMARNEEIVKKLEKHFKPQQKEEVYVPGSLNDDKNSKDRV
ncbi:hypothetical protein MJH12_16950 [bacterium]|nr:hypothetical protein [bacterium]